MEVSSSEGERISSKEGSEDERREEERASAEICGDDDIEYHGQTTFPARVNSTGTF